MHKPERLFEEYPVGRRCQITFLDDDGPYDVTIVAHYDKMVNPPDNEYHINEKPHRTVGLQIRFHGTIPRLYYCPGGPDLHKDAHNYIVWRKGKKESERTKEEIKYGFGQSGFHPVIAGGSKKPRKPYYKICKKTDEEKAQKKARKHRKSNRKKDDSSSSSSSMSSISF